MMTPFDRWLTTEPEPLVIKEVDYHDYMDEDGQYRGPVDKWTCVWCKEPIGMMMHEDPFNLEWLQCWEVVESDVKYCDPCYAAGVPDIDEANDGCGKWGCKECYPERDGE